MRAVVRYKKTSLPGFIHVHIYLELLLCVLSVGSRGASHTEKPVGPTDDSGTVKAEVTDSRVLDRRQAITIRLNFGSPASKTCRTCKRGYFRSKVTNEMMAQKEHWSSSETTRIPLSDVTKRPAEPASHRTICHRCMPCSICPFDMKVATVCTPTQDTECTPLCGENDVFDKMTRSCKKEVKIRQVVVVDNPTDITTVRLDTDFTTGYEINPLMKRPSVNDNNFARPDRGRDSSTGAMEAEHEDGSAGYVTSLFASGAAGIAVLVLVVVIILYVVLRCKQWWKYERPLSQREESHCPLMSSCCVNICKQGNRTVSSIHSTDYSRPSNRESVLHVHLDRGTTIDYQVSRSKESRRANPAKSDDLMLGKVNLDGSPTASESVKESGKPPSTYHNERRHGTENPLEQFIPPLEQSEGPCSSGTQLNTY